MADGIDTQRFDEAMRGRTSERTPDSLGGPLRVVPLDEFTREFLGDSIPGTLLAFLKSHSYATGYTLGRLTFGCVNEMRLSGLDDWSDRCVDEGLLVVGAGLNGDPIVVDLNNDLRVGFVFREQLRSSRKGAVRKYLVDSGLDIGTFYLAAVLPITGFPRDAYEAKRLQTKDWEALAGHAAKWMRGRNPRTRGTAKRQ